MEKCKGCDLSLTKDDIQLVQGTLMTMALKTLAEGGSDLDAVRVAWRTHQVINKFRKIQKDFTDRTSEDDRCSVCKSDLTWQEYMVVAMLLKEAAESVAQNLDKLLIPPKAQQTIVVDSALYLTEVSERFTRVAQFMLEAN